MSVDDATSNGYSQQARGEGASDKKWDKNKFDEMVKGSSPLTLMMMYPS
jgi:hypothetical protein